MRTMIFHTNSNGNSRQIEADEAAMLLGMYPLAYYTAANNYEGGRGFATHQDHRGGRLVHVVACKLDDGTMKGSWLCAEHGGKATMRKTLTAWRSLTATKQEV